MAPFTGATEYVSWVDAQGVVLPEILPGCAGADVTVATSVRAVDGPQVLFAVTEIVPPALPTVVVIELVVLVPVQPLGNVQV